MPYFRAVSKLTMGHQLSIPALLYTVFELCSMGPNDAIFFNQSLSNLAVPEAISFSMGIPSCSPAPALIFAPLWIILLSAIATTGILVAYFIYRKSGEKNRALEQDLLELKRTIAYLQATVGTRTHELKEALARAEGSNKLKTQFVANLSHNVRTPLNAIMGFTQLLRDHSLTPKTRKHYLNVMYNRGQNLLQQINDILIISELEAGNIEIQRKVCNINLLLKELYTIFTSEENRHKKPAVHLRMVHSLTDAMAAIISDPLRLEQIIVILTENALKFTEKGVVEIGYKLDSGFLTFFVRDTGVGIHPGDFNKIFERFGKVTPEKPDSLFPFDGAGLGLYIAKGLVHLLDGAIWLESQPGHGATFYFNIPYIPQKVAPVKHIACAGASASTPNLSGKAILVVEDDFVSYQLMENLLERTGAKLIHVKNGEDAVEVMTFANNIDLILMDMQLPFLSGYEATEQIKVLNPHIPIIAQTANTLENDKAKCLQAGCIDYLSKPIDPDVFVQTIGSHMLKGCR